MSRKIVRTDAAVSSPKSLLRADRRTSRADLDFDLDTVAAALIEDLDPRGPAESLIVGRIALAAWRLRNQSAEDLPGPAVDRDEASFYRGFQALSKLRDTRSPRWEGPANRPERRAIDPSRTTPSAGCPSEDPEDVYGSLWRDRLALDPRVSPSSPVVKGTSLTVGRVVSMIVDGSSWAEILRQHPQLCEADIRACLAYSVEEHGDSLPY